MRNLSISILLLFLAGCAAAYSLSEGGLKLRSSLTDAEALNVVKKLTAKTNEQAGVCSAHTNEQFQSAEPIGVNDSNLVFSSFYKVMVGVSPSVGAGTVTTTISYERRKGTFNINLKSLNKIRILNNPSAYGCINRPASDYLIMIDNPGVGTVPEGRANAVMINVSAKNLEHLIAAFTFLSPNAKLIQGTGF